MSSLQTIVKIGTKSEKKKTKRCNGKLESGTRCENGVTHQEERQILDVFGIDEDGNAREVKFSGESEPNKNGITEAPTLCPTCQLRFYQYLIEPNLVGHRVDDERFEQLRVGIAFEEGIDPDDEDIPEELLEERFNEEFDALEEKEKYDKSELKRRFLNPDYAMV